MLSFSPCCLGIAVKPACVCSGALFATHSRTAQVLPGEPVTVNESMAHSKAAAIDTLFCIRNWLNRCLYKHSSVYC